jgi:hypothetical protein
VQPFITDRPVKDKQGKLLVSKNEQVKLWKEYVSEVLNKDERGRARRKIKNER